MSPFPPRHHALRRLLPHALCTVLALSSSLAPAANPSPTPSPDPDPESPAAERASFRVLDGFEVQLFASERDGAVKPISIRFDARGRLWVVGSTAYPQIRPGEVANDKVTVLEDTDRDGRADRSTVFVDRLQLPLGLEVGDDGCWVSSATELIHARDTNGDDRADERRTVLRGFGTGDAHQTINSFVWGPSGELMFSQGLHANSRVETPWGLAELRQAGLFRLWPRRLQLEPIWSGAMGAHNPYGTVFDRWGQPFVFAGNGHGIYHLTPALVPTDHFLLHPSIWQQGRKFGGADVVENSHWPAQYQGEFLAGGYLQNTVERFRLTESGSTFKVERLPPLIESTNSAFRIVDVRFGPDGALYLCDWYNRLIGHYQTSLRDPGRDHVRGRIWRVTAKGRPPVPWKRLDSRTTPELAAELGSTERWNRQLAKRVLAERPTPETRAAIQSSLRSPTQPNPQTLFEALGVLASHESIETNLLHQAVVSREPGLRAYAARVIGDSWTRLQHPLAWLSPLVNDSHPRVRLEAVVACSRIPRPEAVELAAQATDHPLDHHLDYAFTQTVHALKPHWIQAQRRGTLTFDGKPSRSAAFARADGSGDTVADAVARLNRVAEVALAPDAVDRLARILAASAGPKDLPILLRPRTFTFGTEHLADLQASVLETLRQRATERPVLPDGPLAPQLAPLLNHASPSLRHAALRLAGLWQVDPLRDLVANIACDTQRQTETRQAAFAALGSYAKQDDRDLLVTLTRETSTPPLRLEGIRSLARFPGSHGAALAAEWLAAEPAPEPIVHEILLPFLLRREGPDTLATEIATRPPRAENAKAALALLAASGRNAPRLLALFGQAAAIETHHDLALRDISTLAQEIRQAGQPTRGQSIFERPTLACVNCHATNGTPGKIGPDLGALGTSQSIEFILGALLDPQKEVKEGFVAHEVETRDGEVHQGYLRENTPSELALYDHLTQRVLRFRAVDIASRKQIGSLMPPGLTASLPREDLRDLVAFLSRLGRKD